MPLDFWEVSHDFFTVVSPCYLLILGKILSYWDAIKWGTYQSIVSLLKMKNIQHPVKIFFLIWETKNAPIFTKNLPEIKYTYKSYQLKNYDNRWKTLATALIYI